MSDPGLILVAEVHGLAGLERSLRNLIDGLAAGSRDEPLHPRDPYQPDPGH